MIQLTLTFVSIEAARQALLDIPSNALVSSTPSNTLPEREAPKVLKAAATPAAVVTKAAKPAAATEPPSDPKPVAELSAPVTPAASSASSSEPATIDYPTLQKAVFALAGKSRDAAASVAASMNVKTFKELGQDAWASALVAVNLKMVELETAELEAA